MSVTSLNSQLSSHDQAVVVHGQTTHINQLVINDEAVAEIVYTASSPEQTVIELITLGAVAHRAVGGDIVARDIQQQMDSAVEQTKTVCTQMAGAIKAESDRLFEGDGQTPSISDQLTSSMEKQLTDLLGSDASAGPIAELRSHVEKTMENHQNQLRKNLSLDSSDSPLSSLRDGLVRHIDSSHRAITQQLSEVTQKLAVEEAAAEEREKGTAKGFDFEEVVQAELETIANHKQHIVSETGNEMGALHRKTGDHVITIGYGTAVESRIVVESKNRSLTAKATYDELALARDNREAAASIAVFAKVEQSPMKAPFYLYESGAIIAFDGTNDELLLRVAYEWAERIATDSDNEQAEVDLVGAQTALAELDGALNNTTALTKSLNGIERNLEDSRKHVGLMRDSVAAAASKVRGALNLA